MRTFRHVTIANIRATVLCKHKVFNHCEDVNLCDLFYCDIHFIEVVWN